jgi:uncharacterized protein involved in exopolysaccharide biosynthesis
MEQQVPHFEQESKGVEIGEIIAPFIRQWKWFLLSVIISLTACFFYLRYSTTIYTSKALILIKEDSNRPGGDQFSSLQDVGIISGSSNIQNEIEIFKSRKLLSEVILNLKLNTSITRESKTGLRKQELFDNNPIDFQPIIKDSTLFLTQKHTFELTVINDQKFSLTHSEGSKIGEFRFGDTVQNDICDFVITKTSYFKSFHTDDKFLLGIRPLDGLITSLQNKLTVETVSKDANVLLIKLDGPVISKNNAIINELMRQHELSAIHLKNEIAESTSRFINERMEVITEELSDVDEENRLFKSENNLIDLESDAMQSLAQESETEQIIIEKNIQLRLAEYMNDFLISNESLTTLLPSNLGLNDPTIAQYTDEYNQLVLRRNKILKTAGNKNPAVVNIETQLSSLRDALKMSLNNGVQTIRLEIRTLESKEREYQSHISMIPDFEKKYKEIMRQQQIKETLYLFLLQKREENEITRAATIGNTRIIDAAYSDGVPVSPKRKIVYLALFLLALLLPAVVIYVYQLFNNKIQNEKDIENVGLPCLGYIPFNDEKENIVSFQGARSPISEAFRMLRTNMNFMFSNEKEAAKVIFVTSTQAGEGKTFVSLNLAHTLAQTDKKVVLIGLDLRAPKILEYVDFRIIYILNIQILEYSHFV